MSEIKNDDVIEMINDTGRLAAAQNIANLSSMANAARGANALANDVEFWKWLGRNFNGSGIFESNASMLNYINQGAGKEVWFAKQLQGKGYEWDYMTAQRGSLRNIFKSFDAGDVANRAASDVTEQNFFMGNSSELQMKAYTSSNNPNLHNTPKDMTVVTNAEKVGTVRSNGYEVEEFQDNNTIKSNLDKRMEQVKSGKVSTSYNLKNTAGVMAKAGLVGCVIGVTVEAVASYKSWKNGQLSDEEYLKEVLKAGGDVGLTSAGTAGIMLPVSSLITAAGLSSWINIPVAFVIGGALNKIIAPCFARGEYRQVLSEAKYYQAVENLYDDMLVSMENSSEHYIKFLQGIKSQRNFHENAKAESMRLNKSLEAVYNSI